MKRKLGAAVSHHEREIEELRQDRDLAIEYLSTAMASLDDPEDRAAGLLALRSVAEAYGGLGAIAKSAGISRESLYRALSPRGNPTLKTILAVLGAVGMRLSVERDVRELKGVITKPANRVPVVAMTEAIVRRGARSRARVE